MASSLADKIIPSLIHAKSNMPRRLASLIAFVFSVVVTICHAQELKPFAAKDEWTFRRESTYPGSPPVTNKVRFSTLFKNKNGDNVIAWVRAVSADGQILWQPLGTIPAAVCVEDFVGQTNLDLSNSCNDGLTAGREWQSRSGYLGATEQITFTVIGNEAIEVTAGRFNALKIIGIGKRLNPDKRTDTLAVTYWFVPELKAMARTTREYRSTDGKLRAKFTEELETAKVN